MSTVIFGSQMRPKSSFFVLLILLGIFPSLNAFGKGIVAETRVFVELGNSPENSIIKLCFDRDNSSDKALLVTSLNLTHKDSPKRFDMLKLGAMSAYVSHLTGWFVIQQQSQELWVGLTLKRGENHGELTLGIPGMLRLVRKYPEEYELIYLPSVSTLPDLASASPTVHYADVNEIRVSSPDWGEVVESETTGWKKLAGRVYSVDFGIKKGSTNILTIRRKRTRFGVWLQNGLGPFAGGLSVGALFVAVFVGMAEEIKSKHRLAGFVFVLCITGILLAMSGVWPPNFNIIIFDGANLIGFMIPFFALALFPKRWIGGLKTFVIGFIKAS